MRTIKLLSFYLLVMTSSFAQTFEGEVIYEAKYKSKLPNATDEQIASMMGTKQEYFIKNGNYKTLANGSFIQWQLYINKDNKLYNKFGNSESIFWNDGLVNTNEVHSATINKNAMEILGYKCDELILTTKDGVQKYYFSSKLKIDPKLYEKHKYGNWSEYVSKAGAVPLKMIIDTQQLTMEITATSVIPKQIEDKFFELPANVKVEKSPY